MSTTLTMPAEIEAMLRETGDAYLIFAKKKVTDRKARVAVFTYALRAALDDLSPDERAAWLDFALTEVRR